VRVHVHHEIGIGQALELAMDLVARGARVAHLLGRCGLHGVGQRPAQALARIEQLAAAFRGCATAVAGLLLPDVHHRAVAVGQQLFLAGGAAAEHRDGEGQRQALNQVRGMAFSCAVIDLAAFGIEVDGERLFEVDGDLGAGLDIDGGEGLAVELVDPIRHVPHAARQDRPTASLPLMPTVPMEPRADTDMLPLSLSMSEATPAPAAVIRACEPRYCWALLRRSPLTQGMPWGR
jgi:hypothetical protein